MLTPDQFASNDQDDALRLYYAGVNILGAALGVDPGSAPYDRAGAYGIYNPTGQMQVLSVSTGTAPQGQAAPVYVNVAGYQFTMPMLVLVGVGAWLILRR